MKQKTKKNEKPVVKDRNIFPGSKNDNVKRMPLLDTANCNVLIPYKMTSAAAEIADENKLRLKNSKKQVGKKHSNKMKENVTTEVAMRKRSKRLSLKQRDTKFCCLMCNPVQTKNSKPTTKTLNKPKQSDTYNKNILKQNTSKSVRAENNIHLKKSIDCNVVLERDAEIHKILPCTNECISELNISNFATEPIEYESLKRNTNSNKIETKRLASKVAKMNLQKILRVSLERSSHFEHLQKIKSPKDVYEFVYDPNDEPAPVKRKKKMCKKHLDDSGDENNSMKFVMKRLRQKDLKEKRSKTVRKQNYGTLNKIQTIVTQPPLPIIATNSDIQKEKQLSTKKDGNNISIFTGENFFCDINETKSLFISDSENDHFADDNVLDNNEVDYNVSGKVLSDNVLDDKVSDNHALDNNILNMSTKTIPEQIIESFFETNNGKEQIDDKLTSPNCINIISNIVIHEPNKDSATNKANINFVSVRKNHRNHLSSPWRINISNKNKHTFTVKDNSFVPSYDQDIVIDSSFCETTLSIPYKEQSNKLSSMKNTVQTELLNYISNSKNYPERIENMNSGNIFEDVVTSPRKVLGELNIYQSTPHHNAKRKYISPNMSAIANDENKFHSLFGFTYISDGENSSPKVFNKKNIAPNKKFSPKKEKLKTALFTEKEEHNKPKCVGFNDEVENIDINLDAIQNVDVDLLFQDVDQNEENKIKPKKFRQSYEKLRPKRRRLPSVESESDEEEITEKATAKYVNNQTKKEKKEADRLASLYNSMFEQIEQHELCIV